MRYNLFPTPRKIEYTHESANTSSGLFLDIDETAAKLFPEQISWIKKYFSKRFNENKNGIWVKAEFNETTKEQGYVLNVREQEVDILFKDAHGLYYALQCLQQMLAYDQNLLCGVNIEDHPAILHRGVQIDISRNKIPKKETILKIIDMLSQMRINEFQLYIEGYVFEHEDYQYIFPDKTPITKAEMTEITAYAKERFIEMIPNMNCLGHMDAYLAMPQFNGMAECPDGFMFKNLYHRPAFTIDAYDEKAFAFVTDLMDKLNECFSSPYFNANLDEPFDIGMGKNAKKAELIGKEHIYLDYVKKINEYVNGKGQKMFMWGDVVFTHPEIIDQLPKNVIILDWLYEGDATFREHAKKMKTANLKYYLCPGTSSWCSFTGRSFNMKKNIKDAADNAIAYEAMGVMTTDWGDLGHWQYLPVSYLGFAFTGAYTWNVQTPDDAVHSFLNQFIYLDDANQFSQLMYDLGNYYLLERATVYNTTVSFAVICSKYKFDSLADFKDKMEIMKKLVEHIADENNISFANFQANVRPAEISAYCHDILDKMKNVTLKCDDAALILEEMQNSVRMICHGATLYLLMTELYEHSPSEALEDFELLLNEVDTILENHYEAWIARNKIGGFNQSISQWRHLYEYYKKEINILSEVNHEFLIGFGYSMRSR